MILSVRNCPYPDMIPQDLREACGLCTQSSSLNPCCVLASVPFFMLSSVSGIFLLLNSCLSGTLLPLPPKDFCTPVTLVLCLWLHLLRYVWDCGSPGISLASPRYHVLSGQEMSLTEQSVSLLDRHSVVA